MLKWRNQKRRRNDKVRREAVVHQPFSGLDPFCLEMSPWQNDVNYLRTRRSQLCVQQNHSHLTAPMTLNWAPVGCFYMQTKRLSMYIESSLGPHFKWITTNGVIWISHAYVGKNDPEDSLSLIICIWSIYWLNPSLWRRGGETGWTWGHALSHLFLSSLLTQLKPTQCTGLS